MVGKSGAALETVRVYAERLRARPSCIPSVRVSFEDKAATSFNGFAVFPSSKRPLCALCSCFAISQVHYRSVWATDWGQEGGCGEAGFLGRLSDSWSRMPAIPLGPNSLDIGAAGTAGACFKAGRPAALGQGQRAGLRRQLSLCPCMARARSPCSDLCVLLGLRTPAVLGDPRRVGPSLSVEEPVGGTRTLSGSSAHLRGQADQLLLAD